jgi:hypothetical protein
MENTINSHIEIINISHDSANSLLYSILIYVNVNVQPNFVSRVGIHDTLLPPGYHGKKMTAGVSKNGKPTSAGISFCEMPACILHVVSISANTLRKNKQGFMYRRKPWQQGITPANQG